MGSRQGREVGAGGRACRRARWSVSLPLAGPLTWRLGALLAPSFVRTVLSSPSPSTAIDLHSPPGPLP